MADRPLRLGPDPNRTYLERWNTMHPDRYGRPDTPADTESERHRWSSDDANETGSASSPSGFLESLLGLVILILAPLTGAIATLVIYRWTAPDRLTTGWILSYLGVFLITAWVSAMLVYALRRLLLAAAIVSAIFGIGYLAWHLWLG